MVVFLSRRQRRLQFTTHTAPAPPHPRSEKNLDDVLQTETVYTNVSKVRQRPPERLPSDAQRARQLLSVRGSNLQSRSTERGRSGEISCAAVAAPRPRSESLQAPSAELGLRCQAPPHNAAHARRLSAAQALLAKAEDLQKVFGTVDQQEICKIVRTRLSLSLEQCCRYAHACSQQQDRQSLASHRQPTRLLRVTRVVLDAPHAPQILAKGELQVSDKERKSEYDTLFKVRAATGSFARQRGDVRWLSSAHGILQRVASGEVETNQCSRPVVLGLC